MISEQRQWENKLLAAARQGKTAKILECFNQGVYIECFTKKGRTPLMLASQNNQVEAVKLLLEHGAHPRNWDEDRNEAVHFAAMAGAHSVLELLLQSGRIDVDAMASGGKTPLILATENNHVECVRQLIQAGSNLESFNHTLQTPLFVAAELGHVDCVQELIQAGANFSKRDARGLTPFLIAAKKCHLEVMRILLEAGDNIDQHHAIHGTALHLVATQGNDLACLKFLLDAGANRTLVNNSGYTAFMATAYSRSPNPALRVLLENGEDVNQRDAKGRTALRVVLSYGHTSLLDPLLEFGADVLSPDTTGKTAAEIAQAIRLSTQIQNRLKSAVEKQTLNHAIDLCDSPVLEEDPSGLTL